MTFFRTCILADKCADFIRRITKLDHEIGCHYYFKKNVQRPPLLVANRLVEARRMPHDVSGKSVRGFRVPQFLLALDDIERFAIGCHPTKR